MEKGGGEWGWGWEVGRGEGDGFAGESGVLCRVDVRLVLMRQLFV